MAKVTRASRPETAVKFDASARPAVDPAQLREVALQHTRGWLEAIALSGRAVQAEDVLAFAEAYASGLGAPEAGLPPLPRAGAGEHDGIDAAGDGLPPVPPLRRPVDADAFAKLEAVAARAAHAAVQDAAMTGWARAEFVEASVRQAMRDFVTADAERPDRATGPITGTMAASSTGGGAVGDPNERQAAGMGEGEDIGTGGVLGDGEELREEDVQRGDALDDRVSEEELPGDGDE